MGIRWSDGFAPHRSLPEKNACTTGYAPQSEEAFLVSYFDAVDPVNLV